MNIRTIIGAVLVLLFAAAAALAFEFVDHETEMASIPLLSDVSTEELKAVFLGRIVSDGAVRTYEAFIDTYKTESQSDQHTAAHLFGGALYRTMGTEGLSVCDNSFSFGCYHEFLGEAIATEGFWIVRDLNQGCRDNLGAHALGCQHGIGHGVLAAAGYETEDLADALEHCRGLPYNDPIGGCYGGVFMEYNMRTMLSLDGVPARPDDDGNLHAPCDSVPEYAERACYYWQPQWWTSVMGHSAAAYERMGALCDSLDASTKQKCYEGIGNNTAISSGRARDAASQCRAAAAASDVLHETYCRADAANSFYAVPELRDEAHEVCIGLDGAYKAYCIAQSKNSSGEAQKIIDTITRNAQ